MGLKGLKKLMESVFGHQSFHLLSNSVEKLNQAAILTIRSYLGHQASSSSAEPREVNMVILISGRQNSSKRIVLSYLMLPTSPVA